MMRTVLRSLLAIGLLAAAPIADAAGLVWSIPADGTSATYSGTFSQLVKRTDPTQQDVTLTWNRTIVIRSVGGEDVTYNGQTVPARWIEIEQSTGTLDGGTVQAGPGGRIIVKLLVPESAISGGLVDDGGVPQSFLPAARGFRKIGDGPVEPIETAAFDPSPQITLLGQPQSLAATGESGSVSVGGSTLNGEVWKGQTTTESRRRQVITDTTLVKSPDSPFGPISWDVSTVTSEKQAVQPRSEFEETTKASESMQLVEISSGAISLLQTP